LNGVFPVFLRMKGRRCLVIGGGTVAARKVRALLEAGADVTVLSPALDAQFEDLRRQAGISFVRREYRQGDLKGYSLVVETTGDAGVSERVASEAGSLGVWLNTADVPERCDFFFPAIVRRGDLVLAASTSGVAPGLASRIRQKWEEEFDSRYSAFLEAYGKFREEVRKRFPEDPGKRKAVLESVLDAGLIEESTGSDGDRLLERMMEWIS
jgi:precorrin-2 dehydrogenase/sirohydrochlorin ferrochelatase